jgi:hypothetical protein
VAKGYKWLCYQWNDGTWGAQQRANWPAFKAAAQGKLVATIWLTRPFDGPMVRQAVVESGAAGVLLEGEIPPDKPESVNWPDVIFNLQGLDVAKGVVTNFAPFVDSQSGALRPEIARPLVDAGYACVTENFISESPNSTPPATDFIAKQLGWPRSQPMIEGWEMERYGDMSGFVNVSHWDAGNVL